MNMDGVIVPSVRGLKPSATLAINEICRGLSSEGKPVYRLGLGQSPFPVPAHVERELQAQAHQKAYLPARGLPQLCEAVSEYTRRTEGFDCDAQHVLIGPGTKELMFLLQFVFDAEILLPSPSWVSYEPQAAIVGRDVRWLDSADHAGGLSVEVLDAHCREAPERSRLLVLNYPNNPSGYSYSAQELERVAAACRHHGIVVLSDEIYSGTHFEGEHVSISRFYPEGTIVSNGLSKWCGAGGWRLGWLVFPRQLAELHRAMESLITETFTSVSSPIQYAAVVALEEHEEMDEYLSHSRKILQQLSSAAAKLLRESGALVNNPLGGFYLFPKFPNVEGFASSALFCRALLEDTGVAILPGSDFGRASSELCARLAYVDFDGTAALEAAKASSIDEAFVRQYCAPTVEGITQLCDWLG